MRRLAGLLVGLVAAAALTSCSGSDDPGAAASPTPSTAATPSRAPSPPAPPGNRTCHDLDYDAAVSPTDDSAPVPCTAQHTAMTFAVGDLDTLLEGHLLAVDSDRVQQRVATTCPARLASFVGGTPEDRDLSMLRSVWFTPTVAESDAGAAWYRCDVVALARDSQLAPLTGRLAGVLDKPEGRDRYGMCGTAEPGSPGFDRVICSSAHTWRAIGTVPFAAHHYPGLSVVRDQGQQRCEDIARASADNALDFKWGYEWPTAAQWSAGQHYGLCWSPES